MNIWIIVAILLLVLAAMTIGYFYFKPKDSVKDSVKDYIKLEYRLDKNELTEINISNVSNEEYKMVIAHLMIQQNTDAYIRHYLTYGEKHDINALYSSIKHLITDKLNKEHEIFTLFKTVFETEFDKVFTPLLEETARLFLSTNTTLSFKLLIKLTDVFSSLLREDFVNVTDDMVVSLIEMTLITHLYPRYHHNNLSVFFADPEGLAEEWVIDQGAQINPQSLAVFLKLVKTHSKDVASQEAFYAFTNNKIQLRPRIQRDPVSEPEPVEFGS